MLPTKILGTATGQERRHRCWRMHHWHHRLLHARVLLLHVSRCGVIVETTSHGGLQQDPFRLRPFKSSETVPVHALRVPRVSERKKQREHGWRDGRMCSVAAGVCAAAPACSPCFWWLPSVEDSLKHGNLVSTATAGRPSPSPCAATQTGAQRRTKTRGWIGLRLAHFHLCSGPLCARSPLLSAFASSLSHVVRHHGADAGAAGEEQNECSRAQHRSTACSRRCRPWWWWRWWCASKDRFPSGGRGILQLQR